MNTPCIANHGLSPAHASVIVARCVAFCKLSPILVAVVPEQLLPLVDVPQGHIQDVILTWRVLSHLKSNQSVFHAPASTRSESPQTQRPSVISSRISSFV